ncbi:hypothetical protein [Nonomuraea roseoviolacea]|uniref:Uncharacterized protein n=1 Tax=Nonomuraea roseoviolacea subsp. carminata TaxID=160689 RepID=A0ABT1K8V1_9ACTN|nr:hypothetical protein [Nonomuraea roseoviolacea]MCP2350435.1 hypothetical protein [Nonomuraea roseoviolacea subsp. carminata]
MEMRSGSRRTASDARSSAANDAAEELRAELSGVGILADVHIGYGLALVSVWVSLVVWCDGERYWWRTGWDADRKRVIYAWHPAVEPARAARRIAFRYADLRANHPLSTVIAEPKQ